MSKAPRDVKSDGARPVSAVDPEHLKLYRDAARLPSAHQDVKALRRLIDEYGASVGAGDVLRAMTAGLGLVDVALRMASTPSGDPAHWAYKTGFFEGDDLFRSMADTLHHPHAALVAFAAVAVERDLAWRDSTASH